MKRQNLMKPLEEQVKESDIDDAFNAELKKIEDEYTQHQLELYDKEAEFKQSEFDLLETSEREKTKYQMKAERDRLMKQLELNETMNKKMTKEEVEALKNRIKLLNKQIGSLPYNDFYDVIGLNISDEKKEAINQSLQYAQEAMQSFMQSYVQMAEARQALADKEVEKAKSALEAEIEARNQGYASDVVSAQKELDLARKTQEKAKKQAEKAQKAQLALQTAEQIGNLVTASTLIWKQLGFPWAIPALAVMWGSFAYSKIKAASMVNSSEQYGEGTVELLSGGSHQSGNDVDLGVKADGTRRRAEGGEYFAVINKRNSRKFRKYIPSVINSLNDGTFPSKYLNAYATDDALVFNVNQSSEELKNLSTDVRAIRKANERKTYVDGRGNMIEVYRNVKRVTRN